MKNSVPFPLLILVFLLVACVPSPLFPTTPTLVPTSTVVSSTDMSVATFTSIPPTDIPPWTPTPEPFYGVIKFPFLQADAGNFQLERDAVITMTWEDAPVGAERYDFVMYPHDGSLPIILGTDANSSDGVEIQFMVVPGIAAELRGIAYYAHGKIVSTRFVPSIYSAP